MAASAIEIWHIMFLPLVQVGFLDQFRAININDKGEQEKTKYNVRWIDGAWSCSVVRKPAEETAVPKEAPASQCAESGAAAPAVEACDVQPARTSEAPTSKGANERCT